MNFFPVANPTIRFGVQGRSGFIPLTVDRTTPKADNTATTADKTTVG